jgi:hypothetical protein
MAVSTAYMSAPSATINYPVARSVWAKRNWADAWTWLPYMDCRSAVETAAPSIGSARLRYEYGWIKRENYPVFAGWYPYALSGSYVQVRVGMHNVPGRHYPIWTGVAEIDEHQPHGTALWFQGPQEYTCHELTHLLDRVYIVGAYTEGGYVDRALRFNVREGRGLKRRGNRSQATGSEGVYVYGDAGDEWSNYEIIRHLVQYYGPDGLTFQIVGAWDSLVNVVEEWDFNGMSLFQALNKLIDERRGLGWCLRTNGEGPLYLQIYSILSEPVSVGDYSVPANADQTIVAFDGRIDGQPSIRINELARFDSLIVRGGPIYTTFSLSKADATLEPAWSAAQETAYKAGQTTGTPEAADHDTERKTKKFQAVYQEFRVPAAWDWQAGNGEGGDKHSAVPSVTWDCRIDTANAGSAWSEGHTFERHLCKQVSINTDTGDPEHVPMLAFVQNPEDATKWHPVTALDAAELTNARVRPGDRGLRVRIEPSSINHAAALNHWDGAAESNQEPEYDHEKYIVTVQVATDTHLGVRASLPGVPVRETGRTKIIEYPSAVAWLVLPGTVLDVTDGALVRAADWETERDDSETLRAIAALAAAWYLQPRNEIAFTAQGVSIAHPVGQLVRGVASNWSLTQVGTVVTKREWDFGQGTPLTRWQTGYSELDAAAASGDLSRKGRKRG